MAQEKMFCRISTGSDRIRAGCRGVEMAHSRDCQGWFRKVIFQYSWCQLSLHTLKTEKFIDKKGGKLLHVFQSLVLQPRFATSPLESSVRPVHHVN